RLRGDAPGRDGGVREELAAGVVQLKPTTEVEATSDVKTARPWRGIVPFTHLAREGAWQSPSDGENCLPHSAARRQRGRSRRKRSSARYQWLATSAAGRPAHLPLF